MLIAPRALRKVPKWQTSTGGTVPSLAVDLVVTGFTAAHWCAGLARISGG